MGLPNVSVIVGDGGLGRTVATADGVAGIVTTGIAATGLALNVPAVIYSLQEAVALGIAPDTHAYAHGQISDFYEAAGNGATLWIILVSEATTHAACFVATTGPMDKLLTAAQGAVTIATIALGRASGYTASMTGLVDYNLPTVAADAQTLASAWALKFAPVFILLDGSYLLDPLTGVVSVKGAGDRVGVFLGTSASGSKSASTGRLLGSLAAAPVHQSVARVKSGYFLPEGFLTSGKAISAYSDGQLGSLHDAGYMALRGFQGYFGAFVTDDLTLAAASSDFTSIARRRVMDKAIRLAYIAYVQELHDTINIQQNGKMKPTQVSYIEDVIGRSIRQNMNNSISDFSVYVDPSQNVLSTDRIEVVVKIIPLAYLKEIIVKLGFTNPAV